MPRRAAIRKSKTRNLPKVEANFNENTGILERLVYFNDSLYGQYA